jgi:predicted transcriptional regulator
VCITNQEKELSVANDKIHNFSSRITQLKRELDALRNPCKNGLEDHELGSIFSHSQNGSDNEDAY